MSIKTPPVIKNTCGIPPGLDKYVTSVTSLGRVVTTDDTKKKQRMSQRCSSLRKHTVAVDSHDAFGIGGLSVLEYYKSYMMQSCSDVVSFLF